jgi:DNA-binding NarL/FixJ family response regulator
MTRVIIVDDHPVVRSSVNGQLPTANVYHVRH